MPLELRPLAAGSLAASSATSMARADCRPLDFCFLCTELKEARRDHGHDTERPCDRGPGCQWNPHRQVSHRFTGQAHAGAAPSPVHWGCTRLQRLRNTGPCRHMRHQREITHVLLGMFCRECIIATMTGSKEIIRESGGYKKRIV